MEQKSARTVYVVDDEEIIAQSLARILSHAGFQAIPFNDPFQALTAANTSVPDLLITDVVMPGMTGIDLAIQVRATHPECKILLFSGTAATAHLLEQARNQGHDFELILKPVHPSDLLAKLEGYSQEPTADSTRH